MFWGGAEVAADAYYDLDGCMREACELRSLVAEVSAQFEYLDPTITAVPVQNLFEGAGRQPAAVEFAAAAEPLLAA